MIVAGHQADLLPYSGFWYKMAKADLFDLRIFEAFHVRGYQRRAIMRGSWTSLPVIASPGSTLISEVRILPVETARALAAAITERYRDAEHWKAYGPYLIDLINGIRTEHLWQFNLHLILGVRELLGITTPISIAPPPRGGDSASLVSTLKQYNATAYLSGTNAHAYLGDGEQFADGGIDIVWSAHRPVTADSILSVLMDYDDPMSVVMAESSVGAAGYAAHENLSA